MKKKNTKQIEKAIQNWQKAKEELRKAEVQLSAASHDFLVCDKKLSKASAALPLPIVIEEAIKKPFILKSRILKREKKKRYIIL